MTGRTIDGKEVAKTVELEVRSAVSELAGREITPGLVAVRVGDDPASEIYVRNKAAKARELGIRGEQKHLPGDVRQKDLENVIDELNENDEVDGILLQLPIPGHLDSESLLRRIDPAKDVDGFHPINVGNLQLGRKSLVPCTPAGCIRLINSTGESIEGKHAVVVGRSDIVGKPVAALLLREHATVTICHSRTKNLEEVIGRGEIVVAAVGRPFMIPGSAIREGAIVIDVGINRIGASDPLAARLGDAKRAALEKRGSVIVGDVEFDQAAKRAGWITPVPGGVGPMTIAMLMSNTVEAAKGRRG
ncbi:MAG: bifunctional 5,10-methylenetetrahydrofolate dehydrogenase/5,10-methenyltetrahydrofolate cyclohydrolase [Acidobacteria bacterium]|nr:bifunctional 5,10-methylenetetrahydrofolate dehydrogenase/5,10-methenyltetrahydrofolate cyclohydrolase [Acidobacteriota bacterium]